MERRRDVERFIERRNALNEAKKERESTLDSRAKGANSSRGRERDRERQHSRSPSSSRSRSRNSWRRRSCSRSERSGGDSDDKRRRRRNKKEKHKEQKRRRHNHSDSSDDFDDDHRKRAGLSPASMRNMFSEADDAARRSDARPPGATKFGKQERRGRKPLGKPLGKQSRSDSAAPADVPLSKRRLPPTKPVCPPPSPSPPHPTLTLPPALDLAASISSSVRRVHSPRRTSRCRRCVGRAARRTSSQ